MDFVMFAKRFQRGEKPFEKGLIKANRDKFHNEKFIDFFLKQNYDFTIKGRHPT